MLHVRTPSASPYYWRRVEHSRRTFLGEWFRTGDVMTRDADGFYHHAGREDDCFTVAGQWVVPGDVEALMLTDPRVTDVGVVGAEDAGGLVKPFCFVAAHDGGADGLVDDLTRLAGVRLAPHQRPKRIVVVSELPRTATGKLQRFRLREMAEAQVEEGPAVPGPPSVGGCGGPFRGPPP
ncbi:MAG: AMP-binding protein [Candidatus Rokubacteria bacterium]|nr:AMP-binding protein [Candidatus Rokubacteria bacterium]